MLIVTLKLNNEISWHVYSTKIWLCFKFTNSYRLPRAIYLTLLHFKCIDTINRRWFSSSRKNDEMAHKKTKPTEATHYLSLHTKLVKTKNLQTMCFRNETNCYMYPFLLYKNQLYMQKHHVCFYPFIYKLILL